MPSVLNQSQEEKRKQAILYSRINAIALVVSAFGTVIIAFWGAEESDGALTVASLILVIAFVGLVSTLLQRLYYRIRLGKLDVRHKSASSEED